MTKSKPLVLDRDIHSLLDLMGGVGAVLAAGIIAVLSVCAACFIYRGFRGQRGKDNGDQTARKNEREKDERPVESTGESPDGKSCSENGHLSDTDNMLLPAVSEEDLNASALKELQEIADELLMDLEPEMQDKTDSDLDPWVELDPDENTECEDHIQDDDGGHEVLADASVRSTQLDCQHEEYLDKSETGLIVDADEPSETESAQEIICQRRHQDHVTSSSDQVVKPSNPSKIPFEEESKTSMVEDDGKKFEDHHDWRFPQANNFDCFCYENKATVNRSNGFDIPNYLGFQTDNTFLVGSSTNVSLSHESGEKKKNEDTSMEEKNEISIMDAIMDNNEWLNVGAPEIRGPPWLTPTATSTEEKQAPQEQEGRVKTGLAKEDEVPANKQVATVPPLSQVVNVTFRIHYITYSPSQLVAVTGSLQELGVWESFVPLHRAKDGFWANTITLPVESQVEWKFVLVEDGRISRWEECGNRYLFLTSQDEEVFLDKCWGCC